MSESYGFVPMFMTVVVYLQWYKTTIKTIFVAAFWISLIFEGNIVASECTDLLFGIQLQLFKEGDATEQARDDRLTFHSLTHLCLKSHFTQ